MRAHVVGLGLSAAQLTSAAALAQSVPTPETTPPASTVAPPPALTSNPERDGSKTSYWASGTTRPFLSTSIDVGYLYLRPRVSLGYGTPFSKWIGIDLNPAAGIRFLGGYAGFRASLPRIDLRVGARYTWAFQQHFLAPNLNFHRLDIESQALERSQYTTLEAELTGNLPAGPGTFLGTVSGSVITGVREGVYVFEETLRVIVDPPYLWRGRVGYAVRLGEEGKLSIGVVVDALGMPGRHRHVVRAGLIGSASLSDHIEVVGSLIPPILSPDSIGTRGGDFAQLGIRYRWATGSPPDPVPPAMESQP